MLHFFQKHMRDGEKYMFSFQRLIFL